MEILTTIGETAKHLAAIATVIGFGWAGIKYVPKGYRWLRSWKFFIKKAEYDHLKLIKALHSGCNDEYRRLIVIEAEHQKCEPRYIKVKSELDRLRETCAPYLEQQRRELLDAATGLKPLLRLEELQEIENPRSGKKRLSEALGPLKTNLDFDPRFPKKPR